MTRKQLLETLDEIESKIHSYKLSVEEAYAKLINICSDFSYNEYNLWCLDDLFDNYIDGDTAEEMLKHELEEWWLCRVYYFLWDINPNVSDLFRIDWYWNLEEVHYDDMECLIDEIRDRVGEVEEEEEEVILPF